LNPQLRYATAIMFFLAIASCSKEAPVTTPAAQQKPDVLFDAQQQALEAARQTELIIDKAAEERRKQMEE
jgi:predicted small lipoprotein YifL